MSLPQTVIIVFFCMASFFLEIVFLGTSETRNAFQLCFLMLSSSQATGASHSTFLFSKSVQFFSRALGRKTITVGCPGTS